MNRLSFFYLYWEVTPLDIVWNVGDGTHDFNGVEGFTSWITIGSLVCIYSPLAFWKDDELLMQTRDGRIVSYNLHTKKFKELSIPGSLLPDSTRAFSCLRSLVSVKGGKYTWPLTGLLTSLPTLIFLLLFIYLFRFSFSFLMANHPMLFKFIKCIILQLFYFLPKYIRLCIYIYILLKLL